MADSKADIVVGSTSEPDGPPEDPVFYQLFLATLTVSPDSNQRLEDDPGVQEYIARNPAKNLPAVRRLEVVLRDKRGAIRHAAPPTAGNT